MLCVDHNINTSLVGTVAACPPRLAHALADSGVACLVQFLVARLVTRAAVERAVAHALLLAVDS